MTIADALRRHWREAVLALLLAFPALTLLVLGMVWLWQGGHVLVWAAVAAVLALAALPLQRAVRRQADTEARLALGDLATPAAGWNAAERAAWAQVLAIADTTAPLSFTETETPLALVRDTIAAVAKHFHPEAGDPWAQFTLPEALLLAERLSRDVRREALRHIPGVRAMRLSHLLWVRRQSVRYGETARRGWHIGYGLWRAARAILNPLQAAVQETREFLTGRTQDVLSHRLRAYGTRLLVLEVGRAAIDLYSGRLALSDDDLRAARERDMAGPEADIVAPVRILLAGQVNAGKSSLVNALAQEVRCAVGPLPTTAGAAEHPLALEGRPAVVLVDTAGLGDRAATAELLRQAARADLVLWVASATQPAREPDKTHLGALRAWADAQLERRPPPVLLALTHVDELRPAAEWAPPYDVSAPAAPKARAIRSALDAVARALDIPAGAVVPVAMPPGRELYNLDALWARIALELDEAKLVQLDRLRFGQSALRLREIAQQLGGAGRMILQGIIEVPAVSPSTGSKPKSGERSAGE
jgi:predicted GTPase